EPHSLPQNPFERDEPCKEEHDPPFIPKGVAFDRAGLAPGHALERLDRLERLVELEVAAAAGVRHARQELPVEARVARLERGNLDGERPKRGSLVLRSEPDVVPASDRCTDRE